MPSSFVEARYNLNSSVVEVLTISYNLNMLINYNDLMKAKCDRRNNGERKRNSINNSIYFDYNIFCHDNYDNVTTGKTKHSVLTAQDKIIIN